MMTSISKFFSRVFTSKRTLENLIERMEGSLEDQDQQIKKLEQKLFEMKGYQLKYRVAYLYAEDKDELERYISRRERLEEKREQAELAYMASRHGALQRNAFEQHQAAAISRQRELDIHGLGFLGQAAGGIL